MNSIESNFVPYQIALDMKSIGFDEPCFGYYEIGEFVFWHDSKQEKELLLNCSAPTWKQAFKFFREKYKYDITIPPSGDSKGNTIGYYYEIIFQNWDEGIESDSYDTYEETELECLKKLIEIAKEKLVVSK
jgi:hypothetical protein